MIELASHTHKLEGQQTAFQEKLATITGQTPIIIGLTGGIASGKTAVANLLANRGAKIIDWDVLARQVVADSSSGLAEIVKHFGIGILDEHGELNRAKLGEIVFNDEDALAKLNQITHPLIRKLAWQLQQSYTDEMVEAKTQPAVIAHVVPLLIEAQLAQKFQLIVVVDLPEKTQLARLMARNNYTKSEAEARINSQIDRETRLRCADYIIDNSSDLETTQDQVNQFWRQLEAAKG